MNCFTFSRNMHFFFFLILTTLMAANPSTSTSSAPTEDQPKGLFSNWHVHVVNGLSSNKILLVHCRSADNDLGEHNLTVGSETQWKFKLAVIGRTLFWCFLASSSDHVNAKVEVFWEDTGLFTRCTGYTCIWTAKEDGIYLYDEHIYNWETDKVLLANSTIA